VRQVGYFQEPNSVSVCQSIGLIQIDNQVQGLLQWELCTLAH